MHRSAIFLRQVLIVLIIILLLTGLIWWVLFSHTVRGLMDALFMMGAISIIIGVLLRTGSREGTYNPVYQYIRTFGETTREERRNIDREDLHRSYTDMWVLFVAGIIILALSILLSMFF